MGSKISVAVLGSGMWGKNHVRVWHELNALNVVCDSDAVRLNTLKEDYPNVEFCADAKEVFDRDDVDAVVIATPAPTHFELCKRAMESGLDVLVEKPMALNVREGEILETTAKETGRILLVGHVLEYHPAVLKLRELIAEGKLGKIRYIYSNRLNLGRIRTEENALWSFAPHDIAIILRLMGACLMWSLVMAQDI